MINAIFPNGLNEIKLPAITQWDYNRKLSIAGINTTDNVLQVHFSNEFSRVAIVRAACKEGETWQVNIPNALLQERYNIYAYIYLNEEQSGKTVKKIIIPVLPRQMPDDYPQNVHEEAEINRLIDYTNKLGCQVANYANILSEYKESRLVRPITKAEYEEKAAAGTLLDDVLYCFTDVSLSDIMAESLEPAVIESVKEGIADGTIQISTLEADGLKITPLFTGSASLGSFFDFTIEDGYRYAIEISLDGGNIEATAFTAIAKNGQLSGIICSPLYISGEVLKSFAFQISNNGEKSQFTKLVEMYFTASGVSLTEYAYATGCYITKITKLEKVF